MKKQEAIAHFGTARALARALNISEAAVSLWPEEIPPLRRYQILEILEQREQAAKGKRHRKPEPEARG